MGILLSVLLFASAAIAEVQLHPRLEVQLGTKLGQLRAVPVRTAPSSPRAFLLVYGPDVVIDPYHEMFFYPTGTLNLAVVTAEGRVLWKRDLGRGVVPGFWFCPVFPLDLDGNGSDEIWFVNNIDADHPLSLRGQRLERLDSRTGKSLGTYAWTSPKAQTMSHTYRNFILGGQVRGTPVLVTAQGTYNAMALQGWNADMKQRWSTEIPAGPGPRGSHMSPVVDFDADGVEEVLWGERRIEFDTGKELFCADCDRYDGHSDVIQPVLDWARNRWSFFTCRESDPPRSPRVALYDDKGTRVWGDVQQGHMDVGWVAHLDASGPTAMSLRIDSKALGPKGLVRTGIDEFTWDALTGQPKKLPFSVIGTLPADIDGDGFHELLRDGRSGEGEVLNGKGAILGAYQGVVACASKLLDLPGEQFLAYGKDGIVRIYANTKASDSKRAQRRYAHPYYRANQRLTAVGHNLINLGGL